MARLGVEKMMMHEVRDAFDYMSVRSCGSPAFQSRAGQRIMDGIRGEAEVFEDQGRERLLVFVLGSVTHEQSIRPFPVVIRSRSGD